MTIKRDPIKETEIHELEKNSVTFSVDEEMEPFILAMTSSYAKFRISENPRNPMPIPGFWPALFDYRGKRSLKGIEQNIGAKNGAKPENLARNLRIFWMQLNSEDN